MRISWDIIKEYDLKYLDVKNAKRDNEICFNNQYWKI